MVYTYFSKWQRNGHWQLMNLTLRERLQQKMGKSPYPSAFATDSQSAITTKKKGEVYGFNGGKRVKGRRRHWLVYSLGLLLKIVVTDVNTSERFASAYALVEL